MKKWWPALLLLLLAVASAFFRAEWLRTAAQPPSVAWSRTLGSGEARFAAPTPDGGCVLTGWIAAGAADTDLFIARADRDGNLLWLKRFRGHGYSCGYCIQPVRGGGFIAVGETKSKFGWDHDLYAVRTTENGTPVWEKTFGGPRCDYGWAVAQTRDGGFLIAGGTESFGRGRYDVYLLRLDAAGAKRWERTYGGTGSDCGYALALLPDGCLIAGTTESFGAPGTRIYLLRTDPDGRLRWQKSLGGGGLAYAWSLLKTADGCLIAGEKEVAGKNGSRLAAYLIKLDRCGRMLWEKIYGPESSAAYAVCRTHDGGYLIAGKTESPPGNYAILVAKTDKNGAPQWAKTLPGTGGGSAYSVFQTKDGGYILTGRRGAKEGGSAILLLRLGPPK